MKEIKTLYESKLRPAIANELKARDGIIEQRRKIEKAREGFNGKITEAESNITKWQLAIDEKVSAGKPFDDWLNLISNEHGKIAAYQRQIERLAEQDSELVEQLKDAQAALALRLAQAVDTLRPDVLAILEDRLKAALEVLITFETEAHSIEDEIGCEIERQRALALFRFVGGGELTYKHLEAFMGSIGEDFSHVRRQEAHKAWKEKQAPVSSDQAAA